MLKFPIFYELTKINWTFWATFIRKKPKSINLLRYLKNKRIQTGLKYVNTIT